MNNLKEVEKRSGMGIILMLTIFVAIIYFVTKSPIFLILLVLIPVLGYFFLKKFYKNSNN